jgi:hypothetical protein
MSQLETNPLQNPTEQLNLPKQILNIKPTLGLINFIQDYSFHSKATEIKFDQMDWVKISAKNKYFASPFWTINTTTSWFTQEIDPSFIFKFAQISRTYQTFFVYDALLISLQPTIHPFFQGLTKFAFDPAPTEDYYTRILGVTIDDAAFAQFMTFDLTPKTRDRKDMLIPMLTPFAYITRQPLGLDDGNIDAENYLYNYPMGRIRTRVYSQLETKGTNVAVQMHFSGQIINLKTEGMNYGPPNTSIIG